MLRTLCVCIALAVASPLVLAQAAKPFVGKWNVEWQTDRQRYVAEMEITETGGSWQTSTSNRNNPCAGRKVPMQHDSATADTLDMTLKFSDVITGCGNPTVKLRLDEKGQVIGKRSGFDLKLQRE